MLLYLVTDKIVLGSVSDGNAEIMSSLPDMEYWYTQLVTTMRFYYKLPCADNMIGGYHRQPVTLTLP